MTVCMVCMYVSSERLIANEDSSCCFFKSKKEYILPTLFILVRHNITCAKLLEKQYTLLL